MNEVAMEHWSYAWLSRAEPANQEPRHVVVYVAFGNPLITQKDGYIDSTHLMQYCYLGHNVKDRTVQSFIMNHI